MLFFCIVYSYTPDMFYVRSETEYIKDAIEW